MRKRTNVIVVALAFAVISVGSFAAECHDSGRHEFFASALQRWTKMHSDDNYMAQSYTPTAGAIGYQYSSDRISVGLSMSYEAGTRKYGTSFDIANNIDVRDETFGGTLFGKYENESGWYGGVSAFIGYSKLDAKDTTFAVPTVFVPATFGGEPLSGSSEHDTLFGASLEFGKKIAFGNGFELTPHLGIDYSYMPAEYVNYTSGALNLGPGLPSATFRAIYGSRYQHFVEIPLGVSMAKRIDCGRWTLIPAVDVTLVNSIGQINQYNWSSGFVSRTGSEWKVYGISGDHVGGRIKAGMQVMMDGSFGAGVNYMLEARDHYTDHRIDLTAWLSF